MVEPTSQVRATTRDGSTHLLVDASLDPAAGLLRGTPLGEQPGAAVSMRLGDLKALETRRVSEPKHGTLAVMNAGHFVLIVLIVVSGALTAVAIF